MGTKGKTDGITNGKTEREGGKIRIEKQRWKEGT